MPSSTSAPLPPPALATNASSADTNSPVSARPSSRHDPDQAALRPGTIRINFQGAFIVDDDSPSPSPTREPDEDGFEFKNDTKDIRLPNQASLVSHVAVDIGGSLAKVVYFSQEPHTSHGKSNSTTSSAQPRGGRMHFLKFETADRIDECMELLHRLRLKHQRQNSSSHEDLCVVATGGGAFKYYNDIRDKIGVEVVREDEMECLIIGLDFFIQEIPNEVFTHGPDPLQGAQFLPPRTDIYPYLLVNIGSGVSMIKVSGPREFVRIGGTSLGGGTLWGLLSLITGARSFDDMLAMAEKGDNKAVDMLVRDIYGGDTGYAKIGLKGETIASSFGKVYKMKRDAEREAEDHGGLANGDGPSASDDGLPNGGPGGASSASTANHSSTTFKPEDVSRSLLYAVSYNIGQIAFLQSSIHSLKDIYFGGSFIRGHRQTMNTLSYAISYWSGGQKQAYFLRHEGYLGAVGAFLKRQPRNWGRRNSTDDAPRWEGRLRDDQSG